jgi:hypothetical protein
METIATIIVLLAQLGIIFSIYMIWRNEKVSNYRHDVIEKMFKAAEEDVIAGRDWLWRHEIYMQVPYSDMLYKFWKPLDSFWMDKSFMRGEGKSDGDK